MPRLCHGQLEPTTRHRARPRDPDCAPNASTERLRPKEPTQHRTADMRSQRGATHIEITGGCRKFGQVADLRFWVVVSTDSGCLCKPVRAARAETLLLLTRSVLPWANLMLGSSSLGSARTPGSADHETNRSQHRTKFRAPTRLLRVMSHPWSRVGTEISYPCSRWRGFTSSNGRGVVIPLGAPLEAVEVVVFLRVRVRSNRFGAARAVERLNIGRFVCRGAHGVEAIAVRDRRTNLCHRPGRIQTRGVASTGQCDVAVVRTELSSISAYDLHGRHYRSPSVQTPPKPRPHERRCCGR